MNKNRTAEEILADQIEIQSPTALLEIIKDLHELIDCGLLRQKSGNVFIKDFAQAPPFPADVISMVFETIPEGTLYELNCETYHGSGGLFKRIGSSS